VCGGFFVQSNLLAGIVFISEVVILVTAELTSSNNVFVFPATLIMGAEEVVEEVSAKVGNARPKITIPKRDFNNHPKVSAVACVLVGTMIVTNG
jgi:hypothetical protein